MITRVFLKNWKSHRETEMDFSGGVNVLVGEMGSGKSSVVEGLTFALYGITPRLQSRVVTLDELVRRVPAQQDEAVVEVDFIRDGTTYTVRREITVSGDTATTATSEFREEGDLVTAPQSSEVTEEVERVLGIDYDLFVRAIYAEQNNLDAFLNEAPGQRKEQIDELLRIDRFEDARGTLVTVTNRLKDRRKEAETTLEELQEDIEDAALDELQQEQEALEAELEGLRDEQDELEEQVEEVKERFQELQERKARADALERKQSTLEGTLETLEGRAEDLEEEAGDVADLDATALKEREKTIKTELDDLDEAKEEMQDIQTTLEHRRERRDELQESMQDLEEKVERLEELGDVEETLAEKQEAVDDIDGRIQRATARVEDIQQAIQELSQASEECPTCGQDLTDEHRIEVLQSRKKEQEELEAQIRDAETRKAEIEEEAETLQERRDALLSLKSAPETLAEKKKQLEEIEEAITEGEKRLDELAEVYDPDRITELEDELDRIRTAEERLKVLEDIEETREDLETVEEEREELDFDEDALDRVRETRSEHETRLEVVKNTIQNKEELYEERAQRLEEFQEKVERVDALEARVAGYRDRIDFADRLRTALEETQIELRQRFVADVNQVMQEVWEQVYPYADYPRIRLNAEEGYAVEVEDAEGSWVSVEGEVSGGERHTAALTLRIALSIVLTPEWRILVLDEPTHNLDATAIGDLAETLRTTVSDIVEQLFLITHEEDLEAAVTGKLYLFEKNKTEDGLTRVATGDP